MPHVVNFITLHCKFCGMSSNDVRIFPCPSCADLTCYECVHLYEEGLSCEHMTPRQRGVLYAQDWNDD